jgi:hypothetical protein
MLVLFRDSMTKVRMIDPPNGWLFGFPKEIPEGVGDMTAWLLANGYPQREIDLCGEHFYVKYWTEEREDMPEETAIVLELTKREAAVIAELTSVVSWTMGDYGKEVEAICRALEAELPYEDCTARAKTWFADLDVNQVFMVEKE